MNYELLQIAALLTVIAFGGALRKATGACGSDDLEGLMGFKNGIQMDTSGRLAKWVGKSCCAWEGVVCDNGTTRVTQINLPGLIEKDLFQTQMVGQLSPSITLLTSLEILDLGGLVGLTGTIPQTIGLQMPNLQKLYLYGNNLTGPVPESIGDLPSLQELALHENRISGPIPSTIGSLKKLKRLLLYSNQISGTIPFSFGTLTDLIELDVHDNALMGHIPNSIGQMQALEKLDFKQYA